MAETYSLSAADPEFQRKALQNSQLATLIRDKELLSRIYEAGVQLLTSEALRQCDESSILGALYKAVTLGFRLEPEFGECYLIPRSVAAGKSADGKTTWKKACCFQIGYKGWKALALQSGHVVFIESREVYKEDEFQVKYGTNAYLDHIPAETNSGQTTRFYARAKLANGFEIFEVINKDAAEKSRAFSESQYLKIGTYPNQTKKFSEKPIGFWENGYAAMALRGPIKKLCSFLPLTPSIETGLQSDNTIQYLQKDGTVTTITSSEVEKSAEPIVELNTSGVKPEDVETYITVKEAIESFTTFEQVLKYYTEQFKKGSHAKDRVFVTLVFKQACTLAKTVPELNDFYKSVTDWHKDEGLIKILTNAKKAIETNGK